MLCLYDECNFGIHQVSGNCYGHVNSEHNSECVGDNSEFGAKDFNLKMSLFLILWSHIATLADSI